MSSSRGLLRDCTTGCGTDGSICGTNLKQSSLEHLYSDGDSGNSTAAAEEDDGEYSLYSDVAELEYDYDEELYDEEEDNEPRSIPTDPIGCI